MANLFTWKIFTQGAEISCVAKDIDEARSKIMDTIRQMSDISSTIDSLSETRRELIKDFHSNLDDSVLSKELLRIKIVNLDEQILNLRNGIKANLSIGLKPLSYFTNDVSLIQVLSNTEPTVTEFYPVTIKRDE
jgi:hypothetical protein